MKKESIIRYSVLGFFLILFSIFSLRHFILGGGVAASVDALCPFGGFETLYTLIATGAFIPRIMASSLILAIGILITVLIFRKGFCGYICPFGTVQELLGKIRKNKIKINNKLDRKARYLKYVILVGILIGTAVTGTLVFRAFDPFVTFFHFGKGIFWDYNSAELVEHLIPFIITIVVLGLAIFIDRFWCRYLCPLGATMNLFTKLGLTKIKRDKKTCIDCKICDKVCPMNVKVSNVKYVKDEECINCNQCVTACPKSSLSLNMFKEKYTVFNYIVFILIVFFLAIGISKAAGVWLSVPGTALSNNAGEFNPDNIKGWMTLNDISKETGISTDEMIMEINLPLFIDLDLPLKDIAQKYGIEFETENMREYLRYKEDNKATNIQSNAINEVACPWDIHNDYAPGKCGLYTDQDSNQICDLSE